MIIRQLAPRPCEPDERRSSGVRFFPISRPLARRCTSARPAKPARAHMQRAQLAPCHRPAKGPAARCKWRRQQLRYETTISGRKCQTARASRRRQRRPLNEMTGRVARPKITLNALSASQTSASQRATTLLTCGARFKASALNSISPSAPDRNQSLDARVARDRPQRYLKQRPSPLSRRQRAAAGSCCPAPERASGRALTRSRSSGRERASFE